MFIIRQEQMKAFEEEGYEQFVDETIVHLQTNYPEQTKDTSTPDLQKFVENGVTKAEPYGVVTVTDVRRFLGCMLELGEDFDVAPQTAWAGEILRDESATGTLKMDKIEEQMIFRPIEKI